MTMRAPLESFAQFNEHAQRHFPTEFSNLPHSSTTRDANVKCDCCCLKVHGVFIGQAFERTTARDWQDGKQSIRMLATVVGDDVQVYLVKDKGMLCDHVSYYLDEAAQFASGYFRPFNLVTGNARYYDLEPIIRYYLWAKGNTAAVDGQDTKFDASFRSACRRIGEMQGHQAKTKKTPAQSSENLEGTDERLNQQRPSAQVNTEQKENAAPTMNVRITPIMTKLHESGTPWTSSFPSLPNKMPQGPRDKYVESPKYLAINGGGDDEWLANPERSTNKESIRNHTSIKSASNTQQELSDLRQQVKDTERELEDLKESYTKVISLQAMEIMELKTNLDKGSASAMQTTPSNDDFGKLRELVIGMKRQFTASEVRAKISEHEISGWKDMFMAKIHALELNVRDPAVIDKILADRAALLYMGSK